MKLRTLAAASLAALLAYVALPAQAQDLENDLCGFSPLQATCIRNTYNNEYYLTVYMSDISTASTVWLAVPDAGTVARVYSVINGVISTAAAVLTPRVSGTSLGTISITATGSAAGDVDSLTGLSTAVAQGGSISIETDGGSTGTADATITVVIDR